MKTCTCFGNRKFIWTDEYREKLQKILLNLIQNENVTKFFCGYRGNFDKGFANAVGNLREFFPQIRNTYVLSYRPNEEFELPNCFDDSVYLLERQVPQRLAIIETNKCMVNKSDIVVAGINYRYGGSYAACEYAYKRKKIIISLTDDLKFN